MKPARAEIEGLDFSGCEVGRIERWIEIRLESGRLKRGVEIGDDVELRRDGGKFPRFFKLFEKRAVAEKDLFGGKKLGGVFEFPVLLS